MTRERKQLGAYGERIAARYLQEKGYRILKKNYTCPLGELDLVTEKEGCLIFVEVRTCRGTSFGLPEESVGRVKQRRIRRLAQYYLSAIGYPERAVQFDLVAVQINREKGHVEEIRHLEGVF